MSFGHIDSDGVMVDPRTGSIIDPPERFVSPEAPPEGYERELLTILVEECAEVQQRATKMLRFGVTETQPGQPYDNSVRLSGEVGDLLEVLHAAVDAGLLVEQEIEIGRQRKRRQLDKFLQSRPVPPEDRNNG